MSSLLAPLYDPLLEPFERLGLTRLRQQIVVSARGRVLEVGVGTGRTLPYYRQATEIIGIDPDPRRIRRAHARAAAAVVPVTLRLGEAEDLPFASISFDTAVATFVLCTVRDLDRALAEIRRVLRPGGALRLLEHVRAPQATVATIQDALTPIWRPLAGGCHLNRDTLAAVKRAGFEIERVESRLGGIVLLIFARRPTEPGFSPTP